MVDRQTAVGRPHPRLARVLALVPGCAAILAAALLLVGANQPWLRDPLVDAGLPSQAFGLPYSVLALIGAGVALVAGAGLLRGHRRPASLACLVVGVAVIVAVGDLWTALDDRMHAGEPTNQLGAGAWMAMLGALLAAATGLIAIHAYPAGYVVAAVLAVDIGDVEFDRDLPRRARLVLLLGPTLMVLLPTLMIVALAALMGDGDG
jgi:hypothetical protein